MTQPTLSHDSVEYVQSFQTSAISSGVPHASLLGNDSPSGLDASPYIVSEYEAMHYYAGISPVPPKLIWRTGGLKYPWVKPEGPEACRIVKEIRGVFGHKLNTVWKAVGPLIPDVLKTHKVHWSSIDVARFITIEEGDEKLRGPVVIWVGVYSDSLLGEIDKAANEILNLLARYDIDDVEVEYRESIYKRSVGPNLLRSVSNINTTVDVRGPLTTALGLPITTSHRPYAQGNMGLYVAEGGDSDKVLGLTCHHVLFQTDEKENQDYLLKAGEPLMYVQLLGNGHFEKLLDSIKERIRRHRNMIPLYKTQIQGSERRMKGDDDDEQVAEATKGLRTYQRMLEETIQAIEDLEKFNEKVKKDWSDPSQRIIGHIRTSPARSVLVGEVGFSEDWGTFQLDGTKFRHAFKGNFMDLGAFSFISLKVVSSNVLYSGTDITPDKFISMMSLHEDKPTFKYPDGRLFPLSGMITEELMRAPDMLDQDNERCLFVIKNGGSTGVTIGRATGCESFTNDKDEVIAKEWAIFNYNRKSDVFSDLGDSGSIIVDRFGRIGGLLTSSTGMTKTSDVTYATPMWWLWPRIKEHFPNAHLNPITI